MRQNGKPEWRWSASLTWSYEQFTVGAFTQYIDDVEDTNLLDANGDAWIIDSQITGNLYGQYEFTQGWAADTRLRIGARNITNEGTVNWHLGYLRAGQGSVCPVSIASAGIGATSPPEMIEAEEEAAA